MAWERYAEWYADTPEGFVFAVKAPKFITHMKRLKEIEVPLANFFANGVFELKEKLGPILWQFPPMFAFNPERFEAGVAARLEAAGDPNRRRRFRFSHEGTSVPAIIAG